MEDMNVQEYKSLMLNYYEKYKSEVLNELNKKSVNRPIEELTQAQKEIKKRIENQLTSKYEKFLEGKRYKYKISDYGTVKNVMNNTDGFSSKVFIEVKNEGENFQIRLNSRNSYYLRKLNKGDDFHFKGVRSNNQFSYPFYYGSNSMTLDEIEPTIWDSLKKIFN